MTWEPGEWIVPDCQLSAVEAAEMTMDELWVFFNVQLTRYSGRASRRRAGVCLFKSLHARATACGIRAEFKNGTHTFNRCETTCPGCLKKDRQTVSLGPMEAR